MIIRYETMLETIYETIYEMIYGACKDYKETCLAGTRSGLRNSRSHTPTLRREAVGPRRQAVITMRRTGSAAFRVDGPVD